MEIEVTKFKLQNLFCTTLCKLANLLLIEKNPEAEHDKHTRILSLTCIQHHQTLLEKVHMDRPSFYAGYKTHNSDGDELFNGENIDATQAAQVNILNLRDKLRLILDNIFSVPWNQIVKQHQQKDTMRKLNQFCIATKLENATDDTAMKLDKEQTADQELIEGLVKDAVAKATNGLKQQLAKYEQKSCSDSVKNNGAKTGASTKKSTATKQTKAKKLEARGASNKDATKRSPRTAKNKNGKPSSTKKKASTNSSKKTKIQRNKK